MRVYTVKTLEAGNMFASPGTFIWTCPAGVTSVDIEVAGAGSGGFGGTASSGEGSSGEGSAGEGSGGESDM